jgi:7-cyano-7-deazaguanine synthase
MNEHPDSAVVLLSGGLDSSTLLALAKKEFKSVYALSIFYGQRHDRELIAAQQIAEHYDVEWEILQLHDHITRHIFKGSSQTDKNVPVPHGHYQADNMKTTVVPNRNMIFISLATAYAMSQTLELVGTATHAGDHYIYADCRPEFNYQMTRAIEEASEGKVSLWTPFQRQDKEQILRVGLGLGVPYEKTWTCYEGEDRPCGKCGSCVERAESFEKVGIEDPLQ